MKQAVIKIGGKQILVDEGGKYKVDKFNGKEGESLDIKEVLAVINDKDIILGKPNVEKAIVKINLEEQDKGKKLDVYRYLAKSRYRKHTGHRIPKTVFKVEKISVNN